MTKMDFEKIEETKEKLLTENASICTGIKIKNLFWLSSIKKEKQITSLVFEIDNAKIANLLIEERLVLDRILHGCMTYNSACKVKQYFNCYKYCYISVYCQKNSRYEACSSVFKTLEFFWDKKQNCPLNNDAYIS